MEEKVIKIEIPEGYEIDKEKALLKDFNRSTCVL